MAQILDRSYGFKAFVLDNNENKIFNIIKKGATIPCSGSSNDYMELVISNGNITTITICENDDENDIVDYNPSREFEIQFDFPKSLSPNTRGELIFEIINPSILVIKVIAAEYIRTYEFDISHSDDVRKYKLN